MVSCQNGSNAVYREIAIRVVPVVVRVQHERRRGPTELAEGLDDRRSFGRVDRCCLDDGGDVFECMDMR